MNIGIGKAHGKVILVGEHSVVYGKSAIALPLLSKETTVEIFISKNVNSFSSEYYTGELTSLPINLKGIETLLNLLCEKFSVRISDLSMKISSTIPANRGMGSSAAVSLAIIRAFYNLYNQSLSDREARQLVMVAESINHQNASGIDLETVISQLPIFFNKSEGSSSIQVKIKGYIVIADTGELGNTHAAVGTFKQNLEASSSMLVKLEQLGSLADISKIAIQDGSLDFLASAMNKAHNILKTFGVSSDKLDLFVSLALLNGAIGAKLTGSGQGGCMIALCKTKTIAESVEKALNEAGACETILLDMEEYYEPNR